MANEEDVELFLRGVDTWNEGKQALRQGANDLRPFVRDLSGARIGSRLAMRHAGRQQDATRYQYADMTHCNLRGADFRPLNFDFQHADFTKSDMREAILPEANLTGAKFWDTNLEGAVLYATKLADAVMIETNLVGANLSLACPWEAHLFGAPRVPELDEPLDTTVTSVAHLTQLCMQLAQPPNGTTSTFRFYYRGESRAKGWELRPSVMRESSYRQNESRMLLDMMTRHPEEFSGMDTSLSQWVLVREHYLSTRLLDVTRNPLVALFFACAECESEEARLHLFAVPHELIKPFNSDSISIVANFAKLSCEEQSLLLGKRDGFDLNRAIWYAPDAGHSYVIGKLYHLIGQEKPHFQRRIDPRDFFRVFVVEPQQSLPRLRAQAGAFLISAFHEVFESSKILEWHPSIPTFGHLTFTIPADKKPRILEELRLLNITSETLFPGLEHSARAIMEEHRA